VGIAGVREVTKAQEKKAKTETSIDAERQTYITTVTELFDSLINRDVAGISRFLVKPGTTLAECVVGLMKEKQFTIAGGGAIAGGLIQAALKGQFFTKLGDEVEHWRKKGIISEDPGTKPSGWESWKELLEAIDQDPIDEEKFEALKAMFYDINRVTSHDRDCILSYQLLKIARKLNAGELLLLKAALIVCERGERGQSAHWEAWNTWAARINNAYGGGPFALIRLNEKNLVEYELFSGRHPADPNQVAVEDNRLTDLGMKFVRNIQNYQKLKKIEEGLF
jgi:hypothetical protein